VEAGMFQLIVSPYNEVSDQVKQRSAEGKTEMAAVASALRAVARAYEENEEEHAEEIMSLV